MSGWNEADLTGPDGEDWRVPVSELANRQHRLGTSKVSLIPTAHD